MRFTGGAGGDLLLLCRAARVAGILELGIYATWGLVNLSGLNLRLRSNGREHPAAAGGMNKALSEETELLLMRAEHHSPEPATFYPESDGLAVCAERPEDQACATDILSALHFSGSTLAGLTLSSISGSSARQRGAIYSDNDRLCWRQTPLEVDGLRMALPLTDRASVVQDYVRLVPRRPVVVLVASLSLVAVNFLFGFGFVFPLYISLARNSNSLFSALSPLVSHRFV